MLFPALPPLAARGPQPPLEASLEPHLESLYRLAQVLTGDPESAAGLVENVFAEIRRDAVPAAAHDRVYLLQVLLRQAANAERAGSLALQGPALQQRLALRVAERTLPALLTTLPRTERLLLHLRLSEGLDWGEIARLVPLRETAAHQRFDLIMARLRRRLRTDASPAEAALLEAALPANWLAEVYPRVETATLAATPPTLQARVRHVLRPAAPDAKPAVSPASTRPSSRIRRSIVTVLIVLTAGLTGYALQTSLRQEPEVNLVVLSADQAARVSPSVQSNAAEQLAYYVRDRLGWRVNVPEIDEAALLGVTIHEIAAGVEVPVFVYRDARTGLPITLFTYTYALLDRYGDRIELAREIKHTIAEERSFDAQLIDGNTVLTWRSRDDIFIAVTPLDDPTLSARISS